MKRSFDFVVALLGLGAFGLPMLLIAVVVRLSLGAPVIFAQQRPGWQGKPFTLYKFRTMRDALDAEGKPLADAERLTDLGRFLRATSLDELPELVNVLKGDMSLVGPRPLLTEYLPLYSAHQARRHEVKPGITGWAQVNGRNILSWEDRLAMDVWYVDHHSLSLDLKILWLSLATVFSGHGVSHDGHATMPKFTGTGRNSDA